MPIFEILFKVQDGEHEYHDRQKIVASSKEAAEKWASEYLAEYWGEFETALTEEGYAEGIGEEYRIAKKERVLDVTLQWTWLYDVEKREPVAFKLVRAE